jgi:hypothetical protein
VFGSNAEGPGSTEGAQAITRKWIPEFAEALKRVLAGRNSHSAHREFLAVIRNLSPEVLALCILQGAQHSIGQGENLRDTMLRIGGLIADECWAKGLTEADPDLAQRIEQRVRRQGASSARRKKYAHTLSGSTQPTIGTMSSDCALVNGPCSYCWKNYPAFSLSKMVRAKTTTKVKTSS